MADNGVPRLGAWPHIVCGVSDHRGPPLTQPSPGIGRLPSAGSGLRQGQGLPYPVLLGSPRQRHWGWIAVNWAPFARGMQGDGEMDRMRHGPEDPHRMEAVGRGI